jgi:DNA repair protein RadB
MASEPLPWGVASLDRLLGGGLETDCVTELYGEGGSGKTILCLQATWQAALRDRRVIYVDAEGVSPNRLAQIAGDRLPELLQHLLLSTPRTLDEHTRAVRAACVLAREGRRPVGLVVVDSVTYFYRLSLSGETEEAARHSLAREVADLVSVALHHQIPVLISNQVWRNPREGTLEPLGGTFLQHAAKTILRLDRGDGPFRRAVLVKHRSRSEGIAEFRITSTGVESLG